MDNSPKPINLKDSRFVGVFLDKTFNRLLTFHHAVVGAEHTTILFYADMNGVFIQFTEAFMLNLIHKGEMQKLKVANNGLLAPSTQKEEATA